MSASQQTSTVKEAAQCWFVRRAGVLVWFAELRLVAQESPRYNKSILGLVLKDRLHALLVSKWRSS